MATCWSCDHFTKMISLKPFIKSFQQRVNLKSRVHAIAKHKSKHIVGKCVSDGKADETYYMPCKGSREQLTVLFHNGVAKKDRGETNSPQYLAKRNAFDLWCAQLLAKSLPKYIKHYAKRENITVEIEEISQEAYAVHVKASKTFGVYRTSKSAHSAGGYHGRGTAHNRARPSYTKSSYARRRGYSDNTFIFAAAAAATTGGAC